MVIENCINNLTSGGLEVDSHSIVVTQYNVTDVGELDMNGEANGIIYNPADPGVANSASSTSPSNSLVSTGYNTTLQIMFAILTMSSALISLPKNSNIISKY